MSVYSLADRLHKTLTEIEAMTFEEYLGWVAYFRITEKKLDG
jgi:hypothetical protein